MSMCQSCCSALGITFALGSAALLGLIAGHYVYVLTDSALLGKITLVATFLLTLFVIRLIYDKLLEGPPRRTWAEIEADERNIYDPQNRHIV